VAEIGGVVFVNDSKATNAAAAEVGLRAFDGGVRAILGGSLKGERFDRLADAVRERCISCYLIGEAAELIEQDLQPAWAAGVQHHRCASLGDAVRSAAADARAGEVVLLVPACASFDAYRDYAERGEDFKQLVKELA
jgi:UDP-N-acetylmuramoylalanine--D-glutamate ligase